TSLQRVPLTAPGQVAIGLGTTLNGDALVLGATGSFSAGLEAEQVTRGERGRDRGLAGLRCDAPRQEAWFVGGNTSVGDLTTLVLVNVDDTPATVDVTVYSSAGPAEQPGLGEGITINPHSRTIVNLDTLAPDRKLLAVHVDSRRGRVAAAMRTSSLAGKVALGVDWIPQSVPPAASVLVPGIPQLSDGGSRVVLITNPGVDDTQVSVQVTTSDGQFVPTGMDAITIPAGSTGFVKLNDVAKGSALAVRVTSKDGSPILAGGFVGDVNTDAPAHEFAYTAGSLPLSGPALLTDLVINRPTESTLVLTAPEQAATIKLTLIRVLGTGYSLPKLKDVRVPAGRTVTVKLSSFYRSGANVKIALEVTPVIGSGPVYAARYLAEHGAHGPLTTLLDLQGPATAIARPQVNEDPRVGQ
ncbi:MAG: hypothetical protein JWO12_1361, partial [Frankiales bacterium]|nr:hypothetical protein [Frankiales bacterium]